MPTPSPIAAEPTIQGQDRGGFAVLRLSPISLRTNLRLNNRMEDDDGDEKINPFERWRYKGKEGRTMGLCHSVSEFYAREAAARKQVPVISSPPVPPPVVVPSSLPLAPPPVVASAPPFIVLPSPGGFVRPTVVVEESVDDAVTDLPTYVPRSVTRSTVPRVVRSELTSAAKKRTSKRSLFASTVAGGSAETAAAVARRKAAIPKTKKREVWNTYIGEDVGRTKCFCCKTKDIVQVEFHCGHVTSEADGGTLDVFNLRPICALCNSSMGRRNMEEFMKFCGYGDLQGPLRSSVAAPVPPVPPNP